MSNSFFRFKQFTIHQDQCAMKVTTDGCLFGAWVAEKVKSKNVNTPYCLDIGTGTGLLSLMVAQQNPASAIDAIEIDTAAAGQAKENFNASPRKENITIIQGDVKTKPPPMGTGYSFIFCNPPFYENELASPDPKKNTAHHNNGLKLGELFTLISNILLPSGYFYLLLPYKRIEEIVDSLKIHQLAIRYLTSVRPTAKHDYTRFLVEGQCHADCNESHSQDDLVIKDADNQYTTAFTALMKDYYEFL